MKKPAAKSKPTKESFTATEVGTLIEQFRGEFKTFGERQGSIAEKLDATYNQTARNTEDIGLIKVAVKGISVKLDATHQQVVRNTEEIGSLKVAVKGISKDVEALKAAVRDMSAKIEQLTESIDKLIKTKTDREEFQVLERRVSVIETKIESLSR